MEGFQHRTYVTLFLLVLVTIRAAGSGSAGENIRISGKLLSIKEAPVKLDED